MTSDVHERLREDLRRARAALREAEAALDEADRLLSDASDAGAERALAGSPHDERAFGGREGWRPPQPKAPD